MDDAAHTSGAASTEQVVLATLSPISNGGVIAAYFSCLLAFMYALVGRINLARSGLGCSCEDGSPHLGCHFNLAADSAMASFVVFLSLYRCGVSGAMPLPRARRMIGLYRCLFTILFVSAIAKCAWVTSVEGSCGLVESFWIHLAFVLATAGSFEMVQQPSKPEVAAEAAQILRRLDRIVWSSDLEEGSRVDAQCSICLSEWEGGDAISVAACKHAYHKCCLEKWLVRQIRECSMPTCALCRSDLRAAPHKATAPAAALAQATPAPDVAAAAAGSCGAPESGATACASSDRA